MASTYKKFIEFVTRKETNKNLRAFKSLQGQISAHFLTNAFNDISCIAIKNNDTEVQNYVQNLSDYFRYVSDNCLKEEVNIKGEIVFLQKYMKLQKIKETNQGIKTNLKFKKGLLDEKEILIPPLTIQPLVENAIKHSGIVKKRDGRITIEIVEANKEFKVIIDDNGEGFKNTFGDGKEHVGIKNISERLRAIDGRLEVIDKVDLGETGTRCEITLPKKHEGLNLKSQSCI